MGGLKYLLQKSDINCFQILQQGYEFCQGYVGILLYGKGEDFFDTFSHGFLDKSYGKGH
jgi:hypothetical protein